MKKPKEIPHHQNPRQYLQQSLDRPAKAVVYENAKAGTAYVVESKLKVMLEQDYLSMSKNTVRLPGDMLSIDARASTRNVSPSSLPSQSTIECESIQVNPSTQSGDVAALGSQIVREIVIPQLEKEVK